MSKRTRPWWSRVDAQATSIAAIPDEVIDGTPPETRAVLADIWQERGYSELRVGASFAHLTTELIEYGADEKVIEIASEAVRDELHHSQIAIALAARYRGDEERWPGPQPTTPPVFAPSTGKFHATLFAMTMGCINETLACPILEAQLAPTKSPLVRAALQSVLTDEIDHARMGWAHLASRHVDAETRAQLGAWFPRLLEARLRDLFEPQALPGGGLYDHGILPRRERQKVIHSGLVDVVLPGLAQVGVDAGPARAWTERAFAGLAQEPPLAQ